MTQVISEPSAQSSVQPGNSTPSVLREHAWAAFWLVLATAACFSRLVQFPSDILVGSHAAGQNDVTRQVFAFRTLNPVAYRRTGELPLWNPWGMAGAPFFSNPQSGSFYPFNWLYFCVSEIVCANWLVFFHHWWAGFGTYLLARRLGLSWLASVGAGMFFLGAPYMMAQTCEGHVSQVCLMAWAPWLWLAYERIRSKQRGGIPAAAVVMSLAFFCGHVQELYYLVLTFSLFSFWDGFFTRDPILGTRRWWIPLHWFTAGLLTGGMVAVELLPVCIYLQHAVRAAGITVAQASYGSPEARSLWQLLDPLAYGGPQNSLDPQSYAWGTYWESLFYFGIGPSLLAIWGICRTRGRYPIGRLLAFAAIAILFSFGDKTPLFPIMHRFVPGIAMFRAPMRALFHASFAISLLAGLGLDHLVKTAATETEACRRLSTRFWGCLAIIGAIGLVLALSHVGPFQKSVEMKWPHVHWFLTFGYLFGVSASLYMSLRYPDHCRVYVALSLLVCLGDLALHARIITQTIPLEVWRNSNPILTKVQGELGLNRLSASQRLVSDREAWQLGISKVQTYEPVPLRLWSEFISVLCPNQEPERILIGFRETPLAPYRAPLMDLLGVKYAAVGGHTEQPAAGWKLVNRGYMPLETGLRGGPRYRIAYSLMENQQPLPRAYVVYRARKVEDHKAALTALNSLDPRQEVIVEPGFPELPVAQRELGFTPVEIVHYSPSQIRLHIPALKQEQEQPAYLCLTDLFYPGWSATIDGTAAQIYPGNVAFRVIPLPNNQPCTVTLNYAPPALALGSCISIVVWLIWFLTVVRAIWWKRGRATSHDLGKATI